MHIYQLHPAKHHPFKVPEKFVSLQPFLYSLEAHLVVCSSTYTSEYNCATDVHSGMMFFHGYPLSLKETSGQC